MLPQIPQGWQKLLQDETNKEYYRQLDAFLARESQQFNLLPALDNVFAALQATPYAKVKVLLLGQDPYPTPGHANGLCFSVAPDVRPLPGSLRNIYKELTTDLPGFVAPAHGDLKAWAKQGVLMLNTVLTARAGAANSHQKQGWETFTDRVIQLVNEKESRVVFVLWGRKAQAKIPLVTAPQHRVVAGAHPSPLSVKKFLGSRPFSQVNALLKEARGAPIAWQIP